MKIESRKYLNVETSTCHASTSAYFKDEPVFAWFGGQREGLPDSTIYIQFGDKEESKVYIIGAGNNVARWNPILFPYQDRLYLFVKSGDFCDRWQTFLYDITDLDTDKDEHDCPTSTCRIKWTCKDKTNS